MDRSAIVNELIAEEIEAAPGSGLDEALNEARRARAALQNGLDEYARRTRFVMGLLESMEREYLTHSEKSGVIKIALRWLRDGLPSVASDEIPF